MASSSNSLTRLKELLKHVLCDCLCTNIDIEVQNSSNNTFTINATPTKVNADSSEGTPEVLQDQAEAPASNDLKVT